MLMCRSEGSLSQDIRKKIALFASLPPEAIVSACDVDNIYKVPLTFHEQGVDDFILEHFGVAGAGARARALEGADRALRARRRAPCGSRSWASTCSSRTPTCRCPRRCATPPRCRTAGWRSTGSTPRPCSIPRRRAERLESLDGILIPGGFGGRGWEGKIAAAQVAREERIPYLGICLGMQVAVSEFARNVAGMEGANSTEMDPETPNPVIDLLPEQKEVADLGGTMRLGADPIKLHDGTRAREMYGEAVIYERHRHRYEVNNLLRKRLTNAVDTGGRAPAYLRHLARRAPRRGGRARGAPVLRRLAVPPRVQVAPRAPGAAVPRLHRRRARARRCEACCDVG